MKNSGKEPKSEPYSQEYWETCSWGRVQQEVDFRAKVYLKLPLAEELTSYEGIVPFSVLERMAGPFQGYNPKASLFKPNQKHWEWVYAPFLIKMLQYSFWVCLGKFAFSENKPPQVHWLYFLPDCPEGASDKRFRIPYTVLSLGGTYFQEPFFKDNFKYSYFLLEDLLNSHPSDRLPEHCNGNELLDVGLPLFIRAGREEKSALPRGWCESQPLSLLAFDWTEIWNRSPGQARVEQLYQNLGGNTGPFQNWLNLRYNYSLRCKPDDSNEVRFPRPDNADPISREAYETYVLQLQTDMKTRAEDELKKKGELVELLSSYTHWPQEERYLAGISTTYLKRLLEDKPGLAQKLVNYCALMADSTLDPHTGRPRPAKIVTIPAWLPQDGEGERTGHTAALIACIDKTKLPDDTDLGDAISAFRLASLNFSIQKAESGGIEKGWIDILHTFGHEVSKLSDALFRDSAPQLRTLFNLRKASSDEPANELTLLLPEDDSIAQMISESRLIPIPKFNRCLQKSLAVWAGTRKEARSLQKFGPDSSLSDILEEAADTARTMWAIAELFKNAKWEDWQAGQGWTPREFWEHILYEKETHFLGTLNERQKPLIVKPTDYDVLVDCIDDIEIQNYFVRVLWAALTNAFEHSSSETRISCTYHIDGRGQLIFGILNGLPHVAQRQKRGRRHDGTEAVLKICLSRLQGQLDEFCKTKDETQWNTEFSLPLAPLFRKERNSLT